MSNSFVSIIIVSFNAEKYIEKTIESCLNQTYKNVEILLLDNASKDKTIEIAKKIQFSDRRLSVFEGKENLGPYKGLNFLLDKASGEYIAIQDHDDIWFPEKIEKQVEFLEKNNDFIACGTNTFYSYEDRDILILNQRAKITNFVDHTSLMFRNKGFRYEDKHHFSDDHFEKKILAQEGKIACIQEGLTIHRIKNDKSNLSANRFKISFFHFEDFFNVFPIRKISSWMCLADIFIGKFLPEKLIWFIRKYITQRNRIWINSDSFKEKFKIEF